MAKKCPRITIELQHYTNPSTGLFQTIVWGQIEGMKRSAPSQADFQYAFQKKKRNMVVDPIYYNTTGKGHNLDSYEENCPGTKEKINREAKKRIAAVKKQISSGREIKQRERFQI